MDTNFSVGTIFGVWPGDKLKDITGREQVRGAPRRSAGGRIRFVARQLAGGHQGGRGDGDGETRLACGWECG